MEKRISADDERRLTNAVKTAATLVNCSPERDCSATLAKCLSDNNVDSRFAKIASCAFNKQRTVLRLQSVADNDKIASFPLADADTVLELMGGQSKTASVHAVETAPFEISMSAYPTMAKAAAVQAAKRPLYENTVSDEGLLKHLTGIMQKQAAAHRQLIDQATKLASYIADEKKTVRRALDSVGSFEHELLCNSHSNKLTAIYGKSSEFVKRANTGDPETDLSRRIVKLAAAVQDYKDICGGIRSFERGLDEFTESVGACGEYMSKKAAGAAALGAVLRGSAAAGMTALQGLESVREAANDALSAGFENAAAMYKAKDEGYRPGKVLDSELLIKDRFRDRLLGWSDMTADPLFAMYPAEQVFMATQKAMDMDSSLERPDYRETLRTTVSQLLSQNGRASTADVSALAQTLKGLASADGTLAESAAASVLDEDKVTAPDLELSKNLIAMLNGANVDLNKDYTAAAAAINDREFKDEAERAKEERPVAKTTVKDFNAWLKNEGWRAVPGSGGRLWARANKKGQISRGNRRPLTDLASEFRNANMVFNMTFES